MSLSLRQKITIVIVIIIFLFGALATLAVFRYTKGNLLDREFSNLGFFAYDKAEDLEVVISNIQLEAKNLSEEEILKDYLRSDDPESMKNGAMIVLDSYHVEDIYLAVYLMDVSGLTLLSTDNAFVGNNYSFRDYFQEAIKSKPYIDISLGVTSGELGYYFSYPVFDSTRQAIGVVVMKVMPEVINSIISHDVIVKNGNVMLTDNHGIIIYSSDKKRLFHSLGIIKNDDAEEAASKHFAGIDIEPLSYQRIQDELENISEYKVYQIYDKSDNKDEILGVSRVRDRQFYFIFEQEAEEIISSVNQISYILAFFVIAAALFAILVISFLISRFLRPLEALEHAAINIERGNYDVRLDESKFSSELHRLAVSFNQMAIGLQESKEDIEGKVKEQTKELESRQEEMENQQKAILNILEDVNTERQRSQALAADLSKFKQAVDNASEHITITDPDGTIIYANKATERITGFSLEEIVGHKVGTKSLWGGLMPKEFYQELWRKIKDEKEVFTGEIKNRRKNGEAYYAVTSIAPVFDDNQEIRFFVGIERDVTDQKRAEEKVHKVLNDLQERNQKIEEERAKDEALLTNIADGIVTTDPEGRITRMNRSAEVLMGWSEKEVLGKAVVDVFEMTDENNQSIPVFKRPMALALSSGKKSTTPLGKTYYYFRKDGTRFPVGLSVTPFIWRGTIIGSIAVFRDITIEKSVDQAKTEFVSLASHQLRTPLSTISWYTEMLMSGDAGPINEEQTDYLKEIYEGNQRMIDLVNSLLNVSRIELGTFAVEPEPVNIADLSESVLAELTPDIEAKGMKIERNYDKELPKIKLDPELTRIIIQNLLTNAIKYTPKKGLIKVDVSQDGPNLLIEIKDNGYGIPEKDQKNIFTKMFRADNIKEKDTTGSGLGLYIIKSIVEQSSGKIWFESKENKGTTFFVTIPMSGMEKKSGTRALI